MTVFKWKKVAEVGGAGESQGIIKAGGWLLHHSPLARHAGWLTLSSDVILPVKPACRVV